MFSKGRFMGNQLQLCATALCNHIEYSTISTKNGQGYVTCQSYVSAEQG